MRIKLVLRTTAQVAFSFGILLIVASCVLYIVHIMGADVFSSDTQGLWLYGSPGGSNFGVHVWGLGVEFKGIPGFFTCGEQC